MLSLGRLHVVVHNNVGVGTVAGSGRLTSGHFFFVWDGILFFSGVGAGVVQLSLGSPFLRNI